jgi:hypothetical protein
MSVINTLRTRISKAKKRYHEYNRAHDAMRAWTVSKQIKEHEMRLARAQQEERLRDLKSSLRKKERPTVSRRLDDFFGVRTPPRKRPKRIR